MQRGKDTIGVGVGAFILSDDGRSLLLTKRKRSPVGFWSIPGGAVEFGESFEAALVREVLEETGLVVRMGRLLSLTNHYDPEEGTHWAAPEYRAYVVCFGSSSCAAHD